MLLILKAATISISIIVKMKSRKKTLLSIYYQYNNSISIVNIIKIQDTMAFQICLHFIFQASANTLVYTKMTLDSPPLHDLNTVHTFSMLFKTIFFIFQYLSTLGELLRLGRRCQETEMQNY